VVAVNSEEINAKNLELIQDAEITPQSMSVSTASTGPAGDLMSYRTVLHAEPTGNATKVRVTTEIEIEKQLSKMFHGTAKSRLAATTQAAVEEQLAGLTQFTTEDAKKYRQPATQ
jgi:carbon monoxide dehydrogenase subunit G